MGSTAIRHGKLSRSSARTFYILCMKNNLLYLILPNHGYMQRCVGFWDLLNSTPWKLLIYSNQQLSEILMTETNWNCFKNLEDSREFTISSRIVYIRDTSGLENRKAHPFFLMWPFQNLRRAFSNPLNRRYNKSRSRCVQQRSNLWWLSTLKGSSGEFSIEHITNKKKKWRNGHLNICQIIWSI